MLFLSLPLPIVSVVPINLVFSEASENGVVLGDDTDFNLRGFKVHRHERAESRNGQLKKGEKKKERDITFAVSHAERKEHSKNS